MARSANDVKQMHERDNLVALTLENRERETALIGSKTFGYFNFLDDRRARIRFVGARGFVWLQMFAITDAVSEERTGVRVRERLQPEPLGR